MSDAVPFPSVAEFLFNAPLYAIFKLADDLKDVEVLYGRSGQEQKIDGHCPYCHRQATFEINHVSIPSGDPWNNIKERYRYDSMSVTCARNKNHTIHFWFLINELVIEKVGQSPSLADIANDESKTYRAVLSKEDSSEFHKAIGLAAHGVGIGSFVYMRRIFERLIGKRFEERKTHG
jgi:hypothetical protein